MKSFKEQLTIFESFLDEGPITQKIGSGLKKVFGRKSKDAIEGSLEQFYWNHIIFAGKEIKKLKSALNNNELSYMTPNAAREKIAQMIQKRDHAITRYQKATGQSTGNSVSFLKTN